MMQNSESRKRHEPAPLKDITGEDYEAGWLAGWTAHSIMFPPKPAVRPEVVAERQTQFLAFVQDLSKGGSI
jgi:hypothetical protein